MPVVGLNAADLTLNYDDIMDRMRGGELAMYFGSSMGVKRLADEGIDLEFVQFSDYVTPNNALANGEIDLNAFQHRIYLQSEIDSYGYEINKVISTLSSNRFELKEATLYTAFKRLEESGSITSYWGNEATGARRRYYAITEQGRKNYEALLEEWKDARAMIDELTNKEGY